MIVMKQTQAITILMAILVVGIASASVMTIQHMQTRT